MQLLLRQRLACIVTLIASRASRLIVVDVVTSLSSVSPVHELLSRLVDLQVVAPVLNPQQLVVRLHGNAFAPADQIWIGQPAEQFVVVCKPGGGPILAISNPLADEVFVEEVVRGLERCQAVQQVLLFGHVAAEVTQAVLLGPRSTLHLGENLRFVRLVHAVALLEGLAVGRPHFVLRDLVQVLQRAEAGLLRGEDSPVEEQHVVVVVAAAHVLCTHSTQNRFSY